MTKARRLDMHDCVASQIAAHGLRSVCDANETAVFARELEWLQAEAVEIKYPDLNGLTLVPVVGGGVPAGMRTHTYRELDGFGEAEELDLMTPEEFGTAEIRGAEVTGKFRNIGAKYIYTIEDLRARPSLSFDVEAERSKIARRVIEEKLDRLVFSGSTGSSTAFTGLLANGNSTDDTASAGTPDVETGVEATDVATILNMFRTMVNNGITDTKGIYTQYDFAVSLKLLTKLGKFVPATTAGGGMTVQDFLLRYVPGVRSITFSNRLDGAGAGGKDRILCFPRDPAVIDCLLPTRFEQFAPQLAGMAFTTYCAAKYGGLRIKQIKAIRRCDVTTT